MKKFLIIFSIFICLILQFFGTNNSNKASFDRIDLAINFLILSASSFYPRLIRKENLIEDKITRLYNRENVTSPSSHR